MLQPVTLRQQSPLCDEATQMLVILDNVPGVVFSTDREGRIQLHRGLSTRNTGLAPEELVGRSAFEVFQEIPSIVEGIRRSLAGERVTNESEMDGQTMEASLEPLRGPGGEIVGMVGVGVDVTARKRAQEAFWRTNDMLEAVIRSSPIAMAVVNLEGNVTLWNPAAERMHGWTKEEVLGRSLSVFPSTLQAKVLEEGGITDFQQACPRKDGESIVVSLSAAPLHGASGEITGVLYLEMDISLRKQAEQTMREATLLAEAANRAKSDFLANMSHEIRTPMNGVLGMLDLTLDTPLSEEQREYLTGARISAMSLLTVLNDILDFSRIEARKLTLENIDFDLLDIIEETGFVMAVGAGQKGIELTFDVDGSAPTLLRGDPGRIRQILVNLLGNALKFTAQGEVRVRVSLDRDARSTALLRFEVADTGIGIAPDRAQAIFAPFVQAEGGTTRKYGGSGLGLAISRELATLMHGEIGVESSEGMGTTFWFTIECEKQNPGESEQPAAVCDLRVLVVDAHETSRNVTAKLLKKLRCVVGKAANWDRAEAMLRDAEQSGDPYRIAFIDSRLPFTGQMPAGTVPVLMTHFSDRGQTHDPDSRKGMAHIMKPIFEHPLREVLSRTTGAASFETPQQPRPSIPEDVFDPQAMLERMMGDPDLVGTVINGFLEDIPQQLSDLLRMISDGDVGGAERQAHSIRGAASVLSAERFSETAGKIELEARGGEIGRAAAHVPELEARYEELTSALTRSGLASRERL